MFDLFREIFQTLQHNKLRTALTGLSVAWGIFMLIVLLAMGNGVVNTFQEQMMTPSSQKITIYGGRTSKPFHGYREGRSINLKDRDIARAQRENALYAKEVSSIVFSNTSLKVSAGKKSVSVSFKGAYPSLLELESGTKMFAGRFINDNDLAQRSKVIVLPKTDAEQLFTTVDKAVGAHVNMAGLSFLVVGVHEAKWMRDSYIPYTTAKMLNGNTDEVGNMVVMLQNVATEEDGDAAETSLRKTLAAAHNFSPDDTGALWIWNQFSQGLKGLKAMNILTVSLWMLGLLTLLSGVVGISNIMFVSVKERTHEIGIRRAIGAKPRSILIQIIAESVAITTLFGYIGIVLGTLVTQLLAYLITDESVINDPSVKLSLAFQVTLVLIIAGALAGLAPAMKALKVRPVEALRDE